MLYLINFAEFNENHSLLLVLAILKAGPASFERLQHRLGTGANLHLAKDVYQVAFDRALGEAEVSGDVAIAQSLRRQLQDLGLPDCQVFPEV